MSYNLNAATQGGNITLTTAALTGLSGAATTYSTGATAHSFMNDGKFLTRAQQTTQATPTTNADSTLAFSAQAANTACCYVWSVTAGGVTHVTQGPIVSYTNTAANSTVCPFPIIPGADTPFAYVVIKNGSTGSSWTIGSSNWNATGITIDTVVNICNIPATLPTTA